MFFFSSLFDFYLGFRLFDAAVLFYIILTLLLSNHRLRIRKNMLFSIIFFVIINLIIFLFGRENSAGLGGLYGVLIILITFLVVKMKINNIETIHVIRDVNITLIFHLFFFFTQHGFFLLFNEAIDFRQLSGFGESRITVDYWRPAGLFSEPAHYCLVVNLILALRLQLYKKIQKVDLLIFASVVISGSTGGLFFAVIALVIATVKYGSQTQKILFFCVLSYIIITSYQSVTEKLSVDSVSFVGRFSSYGLKEIFQYIGLFGGNFTPDILASSGIFWIAAKYGLLGIISLVILITFKLNMLMKLTATYIMLSTPIFAYMFFIILVHYFLIIYEKDINSKSSKPRL